MKTESKYSWGFLFPIPLITVYLLEFHKLFTKETQVQAIEEILSKTRSKKNLSSRSVEPLILFSFPSPWKGLKLFLFCGLYMQSIDTADSILFSKYFIWVISIQKLGGKGISYVILAYLSPLNNLALSDLIKVGLSRFNWTCHLAYWIRHHGPIWELSNMTNVFLLRSCSKGANTEAKKTQTQTLT